MSFIGGNPKYSPRIPGHTPQVGDLIGPAAAETGFQVRSYRTIPVTTGRFSLAQGADLLQ